jgi:hypothetical protein
MQEARPVFADGFAWTWLHLIDQCWSRTSQTGLHIVPLIVHQARQI